MTLRRVSACLLLATAISSCGGGEDEATSEPRVPTGDPGPIHVHGLGVNPRDQALFIAAHTGLFRAAAGETRARRVANRYQDTMGFTVTGPDQFLGSGHSDGREGLPPFLGLIRSTDAGRSWQPVSLLGERDFHVLEAAGPRIYGYGSDFETREAGLLVSNDGGRSWAERAVPEPLMSLAIDPRDPDRVVVASEGGTWSSTDAGGGWRPLGVDAGLLAWTGSGDLFLVRIDGAVFVSGDAGRTSEERGSIGGLPAALEADGRDLYVALQDGRIKQSADGGRTWRVRSRP